MLNRKLSLSFVITALLLAAAACHAEPEPATPPTPKIEVVFVLDTTGSMSGMIQAAKDKIWSIANMLVSAKPTPQVKMGLIAYRDRGDEYVTRHTPLNADIDAVYKGLMAFKADGGGDTPESVNQALDEAVTKMAWDSDPNTYRVIFLVGDCPPHMDYKEDVKYPVTCQLAAERGININTILCGNDGTAAKIWEEIATLAKSRTFTVAQSGTPTTPTTPFDGKLAALALDLEGTRIYYGTDQERAAGEKRVAESTALYAGAATTTLAERAGYLGTTEKLAAGEGLHDLISDIIDGKVKPADVDVKLLPEYLRKMSPEERAQYLEDLIAQRKETREIIINLAAERQQWLLDELKKQGNSKSGVDFVIFIAIKEQAAKKHITY